MHSCREYDRLGGASMQHSCREYDRLHRVALHAVALHAVLKGRLSEAGA